MLSTKLVAISLKRLCAKHVYDYGAGSMIPKRREPFDRNIILALINSPSPLPRVTDDLTLGRTTWRWDTPLGRSFRAAIVLGARTGVRKAEISLRPGGQFDHRCANRANVRWHLRGRYYASPPPALLEAATRDDFCIFVPPLSKSDQTGAVWGAKPIYL